MYDQAAIRQPLFALAGRRLSTATIGTKSAVSGDQKDGGATDIRKGVANKAFDSRLGKTGDHIFEECGIAASSGKLGWVRP